MSAVIDDAHEPGDERRAVLHKALDAAAPRVGRQLVGEPAFGYQGSSIGRATTTGEWLHVKVSGEDSDDDDITEAAERIALADHVLPASIPRPQQRHSDLFRHGGHLVYASLTDLAPGRPCSRYSYLTDDDPGIDLAFLRRLRAITDDLAHVETEDPGETLDMEFGGWALKCGVQVDLGFEHRLVGHGDLHWANVRLPEPFLIDWDYWGHVPVGYDAAELLILSLAHRRVASLVQDVFGDRLATADGRRSQVLWCHTVLLAHRYEGTFTALVPHVRAYLTDVLGETLQGPER